jgi:hypothetical protein
VRLNNLPAIVVEPSSGNRRVIYRGDTYDLDVQNRFQISDPKSGTENVFELTQRHGLFDHARPVHSHGQQEVELHLPGMPLSDDDDRIDEGRESHILAMAALDRLSDDELSSALSGHENTAAIIAARNAAKAKNGSIFKRFVGLADEPSSVERLQALEQISPVLPDVITDDTVRTRLADVMRAANAQIPAIAALQTLPADRLEEAFSFAGAVSGEAAAARFDSFREESGESLDDLDSIDQFVSRAELSDVDPARLTRALRQTVAGRQEQQSLKFNVTHTFGNVREIGALTALNDLEESELRSVLGGVADDTRKKAVIEAVIKAVMELRRSKDPVLTRQLSLAAAAEQDPRLKPLLEMPKAIEALDKSNTVVKDYT